MQYSYFIPVNKVYSLHLAAVYRFMQLCRHELIYFLYYLHILCYSVIYTPLASYSAN